MDWTPVVVAGLGAVGLGLSTIGPALIGRKINQVHAEVKTNHGKTAAQYLEMIEEIKDGQDALFGLLADHTEQDARQFKELNDKLAA